MTRAHRPKAGFWIRLCVVLLYPLDSLLFKLTWHHLERIPEHGGVLLAVNHISQADTPAMARLVWQSGRIPRFLIKSSAFEWPILGTIMRGAGQIPVHRGTSEAAGSLTDAIEALHRGEAVIIYPEGTITAEPDYSPMQARTGVARIALACADIPVIPIGQWGAQHMLGRGGRFRPFPRKRHQASVGEPIDLRAYLNKPPDAQALRQLTDEVMAAITLEVDSLRNTARKRRESRTRASRTRRS